MIADYALDDVVDRALAEDIAAGDITTESVVDAEARAHARARAKSRLVVCGGDVFARAFYRVDPGVRVERLVPDGAWAEPGTVLWEVEGAARSVLTAERVALNFAQRLSGIATLTRRYVEALPPASKTRITDTRKTTPGLRTLERYAVRSGSGHNHRNDLASGVLIKNNHIAAGRGISAAIERARRIAPHTSRIEVEVGSIAELEQALDAGADIVMLDNFAIAEIETALGRARGRAVIEVSGGVTLEAVPALGALGADVISVGALTHSAPAADIALELERLAP
ncbi:MAG TPA: carboxylating nicotinate-nucleotide diphosphorylase [Polyangiaceae bacterium]